MVVKNSLSISTIHGNYHLPGYSFDLTDVIQANEEIATETNGHQMQAKSLVTSESSDRNLCQDKKSGCPGWKWACTNNYWKNWMAHYCPKSCGLCSGIYIAESISTNPSMHKA